MTTRMLVATLAAIVALLGSPRPAHAQIETVKITVDGLTCNLCAAGLDRSLRRVDGVAGVRVVLDSQVATIRLKPNTPVAPAQLRAAVDRAGQRLRGIELQVRGTVRRENGRYQLQSPAPVQMFALRDDPKLEAVAGKSVRLRGRVTSPDAPAVELEILEVMP
jgi:copper chaperone CopZ